MYVKLNEIIQSYCGSVTDLSLSNWFVAKYNHGVIIEETWQWIFSPLPLLLSPPPPSPLFSSFPFLLISPDIQEFHSHTLENTSKTTETKTDETLKLAERWEQRDPPIPVETTELVKKTLEVDKVGVLMYRVSLLSSQWMQPSDWSKCSFEVFDIFDVLASWLQCCTDETNFRLGP